MSVKPSNRRVATENAAHATSVAMRTAEVDERLDGGKLEGAWLDFYRSVAPRKREVRRAKEMFVRLTAAIRPSRK